MRQLVSILLAALSLLAVSCGRSPQTESAPEVPELLTAVPSDVLCVGLYGRLDRGMNKMLDSVSVLRKLDYGRLSHARSAIALYDIGSLSELLIIDAGKHSADTSSSVRSLLAQADSFRISAAFIPLTTRDALILSPSETVFKVVNRHLASESSILDAPNFGRVLEVLPDGETLICRNSGFPKLLPSRVTPALSKRVIPFLRDACEWTVYSEGRIIPVQSDAERYFCNFCASLQEAPSRLGSIMPDSTSFVLDIPIADVQEYRRAYEVWLDARVALESYQRTLESLRKSTGTRPVAWEKSNDIKEVAVVEKDGVRLNLMRVPSSSKQAGVAVNPYTGFLRALYGEDFNPADSCMIRRGNWIVSGPRTALENYQPAGDKNKSWPSRARIAVKTPLVRLAWTNESIRIWDSNR
ncbi:MAG: hypothetical protein J6S62_03470 [Bacteroidales bacterium]|nr:hypothetical protein [Bacteroidales bacterium]